MKHNVQFISLQEDDKDIIVAFVVDDAEMGSKSLIFHRTLFFEELLDEEEKGVRVSLEGDFFDEEEFNMLNSFKISNDDIGIVTSFREYKLDISNIEKSEIADMIQLLKKQNHDNRFTLHIA